MLTFLPVLAGGRRLGSPAVGLAGWLGGEMERTGKTRFGLGALFVIFS
jgi:hypothetical protein